MSRTSLLDLWQFPLHSKFYETLRLLPPEEGHEVLSRLRDAEIDSYEGDALADFAAQVKPRLALAPHLALSHDLDVVAAEYARFMLRRYLDGVFLLAYANDDRVVGLIEADYPIELQRALERGRGAILLAYHVGAYPSIIPILSWTYPVTTVTEAAAWPLFEQMRQSYVSQLDIEGVGLPDPLVLVKLARALKRGRILCLYAEYSYGVHQPQTEVPFMGTSVLAPEGAVWLARKFDVPIFTCMFKSHEPGRFQMRLAGPLPTTAPEACLTEMFQILEAELLTDRPGEWWCWTVFEEMVAAPAAARKENNHVIAHT